MVSSAATFLASVLEDGAGWACTVAVGETLGIGDTEGDCWLEATAGAVDDAATEAWIDIDACAEVEAEAEAEVVPPCATVPETGTV